MVPGGGRCYNSPARLADADNAGEVQGHVSAPAVQGFREVAWGDGSRKRCETINDSFPSLHRQPTQVTGYFASSKKGYNPLRSLGKAGTSPATLLCLIFGEFRPSCIHTISPVTCSPGSQLDSWGSFKNTPTPDQFILKILRVGPRHWSV